MNLSILVLLCTLILTSTTASLIDYSSDDATADIAALRLEIDALADELKSSKEESKKFNTRLGALTVDVATTFHRGASPVEGAIGR